MPKRDPLTRQTAEANIRSWHSTTPSAPHATTGRRSRGASASNGSPSLPSSEHSRSRSENDPSGNMLYFGEGLSPEQAIRAYKSPTPGPPPKSSGSSTVGKPSAATGDASGRDASGYLTSGVGSTNPMSGTYSSLTYGGSLQYNYAGAQSYGAGTADPAGNGLV